MVVVVVVVGCEEHVKNILWSCLNLLCAFPSSFFLFFFLFLFCCLRERPGEMLGTPKPKESFGALLNARNVVSHNHGRMHLSIAPAISMRKFCQARHLDRQAQFLDRMSASATITHK